MTYLLLWNRERAVKSSFGPVSRPGYTIVYVTCASKALPTMLRNGKSTDLPPKRPKLLFMTYVRYAYPMISHAF